MWLRLKALAIFCSGVAFANKSPASCSTVKLVKGHVVIEGLDHPVAPDPLKGVAVLLETVAVGVAGRIQPGKGQPFSKMRTGEVAVD